jgi:CRP-like cAMP-binding protein
MPIDAERFRALFPKLCGSLQDAALAPLLESMRPRPFSPGERLCTQGVHSARAIFILRGAVDIQVTAPGVTVTLGTLEAGGWTNAIPLIEPGTAEFDVVAQTIGAAMEMTHGDLTALRRDHPNTARVFLSGLIADLSHRLRLSQLSVGTQSGAETRNAREATGWLSGTTLPGAIAPEEN